MNLENYTILFLEDEKNIGETLTERLKEEYSDVTWVTTVAEADAELTKRHFDLALLDISLPDGSGFDTAEQIRNTHPTTAVVFLTAMGTADDRIRGLELGAEDYVVKPFHLRELLLRIRNVLKRTQRLTNHTHSLVKIGSASINFERFTATVDNTTRTLTHKESLLLQILLEKCGQVVSRDEILDRVWPEGEFPSQRTVDNFIVKIRRLIDGANARKSCITSIRSIGYRLEDQALKKAKNT
ncbi:MAG: response regulator transcription factor [Gammaproteobacteria bacterium]|nr:response regulator transcription factor [Gammaproteobacteria bacterium]MCP4089789.1 response regulator transcription factor [Gammaproteobacteria bacterium]MCP4278194.1 response regulator transcription factor [Gammaproteobacteria bacterium]MCP4831913.1 response regulator transcription factor [Gammaproteobacteria bacterium]MCP4927615.1 response regulator transcription factor [Gammaproteobacteria bacterium]